MMFVLQVQPKKELSVKSRINRLGHAALVPMRTDLIRKDGKVTKQIQILFNGYVFVDVLMTDCLYYQIKEVPGVIRFLGNGKPKQLTIDEVEYIEWLNNRGRPIELSDVDLKGNVIAGPLAAKKESITKIDRRNRKAKVNVKFAGEIKEISLGIRLLKR